MLFGAWSTLAGAQSFQGVSVLGSTMAGSSAEAVMLNQIEDNKGLRREVVFSSAAALLSGDTNNLRDIYLRSSGGSPYLRISVATGGVQSIGGPSSEPASTASGNDIVFSSTATNLVSGDSNGLSDIFLRRPFSDETLRVSVASDGTQANGPSFRPAISANGRFVAFVSSASNLVPFDTNGGTDVFVRDLVAGTTERVSLRSDRAQAAASGPDARVSISGDGRWVAFSSAANDLVPGDSNDVSDIFLHDRLNDTTTRISVDTIEDNPNGASFNPRISADARFVAFDSLASDLVFSDTNAAADVFVRLLGARRTERVSISTTGSQGNGASTAPSISADGRFVAFSSLATNLGEGADTNGQADIFLRDRASGTTRSRVQGNGASTEASIAPNGRALVFSTLATTLGIPDGNGSSDVWRALGRPDAVLSIQAPSPPNPGVGNYFRVPVKVVDPTGLGPVPRGGVELVLVGGGRCTVRLLDTLGEGSCELASQGAGAQEIEGRFLGDADYAPSTASRTVTISPTSSTLSTVVRAPAPSLPGQAIYVQADLRPRGGSPSGSIEFSSGADSCIATLPESGCLLQVPASNVTITASYSGDGEFGPANALAVPHTVTDSTKLRLPSASSGDGRGFGGEADFGAGAWSRDGRYYVFATEQRWLVPEDDNDLIDVFLLDRRLGLIRRLSAPTGGGSANNDSVNPTISGNGRYAAFLTYASNLFPGDTNGAGDVVVVDLDSGSLEVASVSSSGTLGNQAAFSPSLSDDGKWVVFHSRASNLVAGDTNTQSDVFLRDRVGLQTRRISVTSAGAEANGGTTGSLGARISADGRYVVYQSSFSNLVTGDSNNNEDIFRFDVLTGRVIRVSVSSSGLQLPAGARSPSMSADGDRIVFHSNSPLDDDSADTNGVDDVYLHEVSAGTTQRVSTDSSGTLGSAASRNAVLSADGQWLAFVSSASNLYPCCSDGTQVLLRPVDFDFGTLQLASSRPDGLPGAGNSQFPVLAEDGNRVAFIGGSDLDLKAPRGGHLIRDEGFTQAVQRAPIGQQADGSSYGSALSASGRQLAFLSEARNLGPDTGGHAQVFHLNLDTQELRLVSEASGVPGDAASIFRTALSANGRIVAFTSDASNLVSADSNKNSDVFVRNLDAGSVERVSLNFAGAQSPTGGVLAGMSRDGRWVLFLSKSDLQDPSIAPPQNRGPLAPNKLYLRDRQNGDTLLMSAGLGNAPIDNEVIAAVGPSDDGCKVAFLSAATNLVSGVADGLVHVYHYNHCTGVMRLVDQNSELRGNRDAFDLAMDAEGRRVAFVTDADNLGGPVDYQSKLFLADLNGGPLSLQGLSETGTPPANGVASGLALSPDARVLLFRSVNLIGNQVERRPLRSAADYRAERMEARGIFSETTLYVRDVIAGTSLVAEFTPGLIGEPAISGDRAFIAYGSASDFLSPGDRNGVADIYRVPNPLPAGGPNTCTRNGAGEWADATRWTCTPLSGVVPGPGDTAIFDSADDAATLTAPAIVATLDLRAGLVNGGNALTVSTQFLWSGGTLEAPDTFVPITLPLGSTSTLSGGAKTLRRRQLVNQGDLTWSAGTLTLAGANTEFRNDANVIIDVASGTLRLASDGATGQFFHHTFGSDRSVIKRGAGRYEMDDQIEFRNGNSVLVEAGTASFTGPGTGDLGPYQVDNGGILEFNLRAGQTRSIAGPIGGGGSLLKLGQGDVQLTGAFGADGAAVQDGRLLFLQSGTVALTHLLVSGSGTLGGSANLQAQRLIWSGGTILGTAGTTLQLLGSGVNESTLLGAAKCLDARQLIFAGEARWTAGKLCMRSAARIEISSSGRLEVQTTLTESLENNDPSAVQLLVQGQLRKQGAGVLDSDVPTTVNGSLIVAEGSLTQRATLTGTGLGSIAAGARVQFAPTGSIDAALPFTGNGEIVTLAGTTRLLRPITGNTLNLLVQGGTARAEAPLALRALGVSGGSLQILQSVSSAAASSYSGGTIQIFGGTLDFSAALTINVAGSDRLISCESGCSGGALRLLAGADVGINGSFKAALTGGLPLILDDPAARLGIGTGAGLELSGADQLRRGTLVVDGALTRATGALAVGNGTALSLSGNGTLRAAAGITLNATVAPGNAGIGQLTLDGPSAISGGELRMDLASAASFDRIVMAGTSSIALNPVAQLRPGGPYTPASTDVFPLLQHAAGARSGTLSLIGGAPSFVLEYAATAVEYRQPAGPRSCRFNNLSSGVWDDAANWICTPAGGFPGVADTAIVDNGGTVVQNGSRTVTGLQLANGSISSTTHPLIVTGSFSWTGGRFTGSSDSSDFVRVESTATSVTLGGGQKVLTERELRLDADATWTTGLIELGSNGQLLIFPTRTLTTTPNTTPPEFIFGSGVGARVNNQGSILKTGPGQSGIESSVLYEGTGSLQVAAAGGELFLHAPSSFIAGELRTATGGRLVFANSDQSFASTARLLGNGEIQFGRNTPPTQIDGSTGLHRVPAAAFNLSSGASVTVLDASLQIEAPGAVAFERLTLGHPLGVLAGNSILSVTQSMTWSAGTIAGGGDPGIDFDVASTATATLPGTGLRNLTRTLDVAGTLVVEGGTLRLDGLNEIRIQSGALLRLSGSDTSTLSAGAGYFPFPLQNSGRIERQGGGITLLSMGLQHDNELVVNAGGTLEVGDFSTGPAARFVVNGTLRHPSLLSFGGGSVEGTGTLQATVVNNLAADFRPGGAAAGTLTVNGEYRQQSDARLTLDLLGTGCALADRLVATAAASLAGGLTLNPAGGCTPVAPQEFLLLDATTLTGTFAGVGGIPTGYGLDYRNSAGDVVLQSTGPRVCRFNVTSGIWDNPANWVCTPAGGFPGEPDTAIVDNGGTLDQNGPRTVSGLELASGTIRSVDDALVVNSSFRWTGGRFVGGTGTSDSVFVAATASTVELGGGQKILAGRTLALNANASWTTGLIELSQGALISLFPNRTLTTEPGATLAEAIVGGTGGGSLLNQGRILKRGIGVSGIETTVSYEGSGAIEVEAGEFYLHAPSTAIADQLQVAAGARLVFARSDQQFTSAARFTGAGRLIFGRPDTGTTGIDTGSTRGIHRAAAASFTLNPAAVVEVQNAALLISGGVALDRLVLGHPAAELGGDDNIAVRQNLLWQGGSVTGFTPAQAFRIAGGATATLASAANKRLVGRTLALDGQLTASGGPLRLENLAAWQIAPSGQFRSEADAGFAVECTGSCASPALLNNGRIERSGTGTTRIGVPTLNDGMLEVQSGARVEVGSFATDGASVITVNGELLSTGSLRIDGGLVQGNGRIIAEEVDNVGARFAPGVAGSGQLTVQSSYTQQADGQLQIDLLGSGCTQADRLIVTGPATLAGAVQISSSGGCAPLAPQQFLLVDAATLTGTFAAVSGIPTGYELDYRNSAGDVVLQPRLLASLITITAIEPRPTPVGQPYTVTLSVSPASTGPAPTGTVTVSAAAPFTGESCTITLPATSCTMPAATLPGIRDLGASYSGDLVYLPSSASSTHPVRATPTITALGQTPTRTVVGEPFTVRARVSNPLSTLTPTGVVRVRPLPLGAAVDCTLVETAPGTAEASCAGVFSPIAAAKLLDIRYLGAENQTFSAASTSSVQEIDSANTTLALASTPNPSSPGAPVQVDFTLAAAQPSQSPLSAISGILSVTDGVDSCTATLPVTRCTLTLTTTGVRQLRARYLGDANFNPSIEVAREHVVADGGAELVIRKRNLLRTLPGGAPVVYVVEVENRGPLAVTALVRDPVPAGLSNFRWTCSGVSGAQCPASGSGPLNENVTMPVGGLVRFVLTADVQREPEVIVLQEARVEPSTGVTDPNPANNVARDIDPIGLSGDGFEGEEQE